MKTSTDPETLENFAISMGVTIESSAPRGEVEPARSKESKPWPHIAYDVTLKRNGRAIWSGPFRLGVGHVKTPPKFEHNPPGLTTDEVYALNTLRAKPYATLADPTLAASVAAKLAKAQNVVPALKDVLYSFIMDGSPYFQGASFEEWADEYGYDTDSRRAEKMYAECMDTGRRISRAFNAAEIAAMQDLAWDM